MADAAGSAAHGFSPQYRGAGYALGFAVGGFFDGILLHQVLQWHHLLSGLAGGRFGDIRFQILVDGLFHLLMYIIGGAGLWLLWRSRRETALPSADRLIAANVLIGFGAWHMLDGIVSHCLLGIHRVKMNSDAPLFWDITWFVVFGVAFVALGLFLRPSGRWPRKRLPAAPAAIVALVVLMGTAALLPPRGDAEASTLVIFAPGTSAAQAMAATAGIGGRLIWSDESNTVFAIDLPQDADTSLLYRKGALFVSNRWLSAGCLNWFGLPETA